MVVDRSGIHRARKLAPTLDHDKDTFELHFLPAHSGHHLNPIEGFWRRMKEVIGAGAVLRICLSSTGVPDKCSWRIKSGRSMSSVGSPFRLELHGFC